MDEAGGRECEESRVKNRGSCRLNEMEGRCESDRARGEMYPAIFGNEKICAIVRMCVHYNLSTNRSNFGVFFFLLTGSFISLFRLVNKVNFLRFLGQ